MVLSAVAALDEGTSRQLLFIRLGFWSNSSSWPGDTTGEGTENTAAVEDDEVTAAAAAAATAAVEEKTEGRSCLGCTNSRGSCCCC